MPVVSPTQRRYDRLFFRWMLSYMTMLAIPLVLLAVTAAFSISSIRSEARTLERTLVAQVRNVFDTIIDDVRNSSYSIEFNEVVRNVTESALPLTTSQRFELYRLIGNLRDYRLSNPYTKEYFLYFRNTGLVVTNNGTMSARDYYASYSRWGTESFSAWLAIIHSDHDHGLLVEPSPSPLQSSSLLQITSLPAIRPRRVKGCVAIRLDSAALTKTLDDMSAGLPYSLAVLDAEGTVIVATDIATASAIGSPPPNEEAFRMEISGSDYTVTYDRSQILDLHYVAYLPNELYLARENRVRFLFIAGTMVCLILGLGASYAHTIRHYDPIHSIVALLESNISLLKESSQDDIDYIRKALRGILADRQRSREILAEHEADLKYSVLRKLLHGRSQSPALREQEMREHGVCLDYPYFTVSMLVFENAPRAVSSETHFSVVSHIIEEELGDGTRVETLPIERDTGECLCLIINTPMVGDDLEALNEHLVGGAIRARSRVVSQYRLVITMSLSRTCEGIVSLPDLFAESMRGLDYRLIRGKGEIIPYREHSRNRISIFESYYTLEEEQKLSNRIRHGDFDGAHRIIAELFGALARRTSMSVEIARFAVFSIINTVLASLGSADAIVDEAFLREIKPTERLLQCDSFEEMRDAIEGILVELSARSETTRSAARKIEAVKDFVRANYADYQLNVSRVADVFDTNISYLSRSFKARTGETLSGFVNRVRVDRAATILRSEPEATLKAVADRCGFNGENALIRVFKRYHGVTPGRFKRLPQVKD